MASRSWLSWDPGYQILAVLGSRIPDPGYQILVTTSWQPDTVYQVLVIRSRLPDPGDQIQATTSWLPDTGDLIPATRSWLPDLGSQAGVIIYFYEYIYIKIFIIRRETIPDERTTHTYLQSQYFSVCFAAHTNIYLYSANHNTREVVVVCGGGRGGGGVWGWG